MRSSAPVSAPASSPDERVVITHVPGTPGRPGLEGTPAKPGPGLIRYEEGAGIHGYYWVEDLDAALNGEITKYGCVPSLIHSSAARLMLDGLLSLYPRPENSMLLRIAEQIVRSAGSISSFGHFGFLDAMKHSVVLDGRTPAVPGVDAVAEVPGKVELDLPEEFAFSLGTLAYFSALNRASGLSGEAARTLRNFAIGHDLARYEDQIFRRIPAKLKLPTDHRPKTSATVEPVLIHVPGTPAVPGTRDTEKHSGRGIFRVTTRGFCWYYLVNDVAPIFADWEKSLWHNPKNGFLWDPSAARAVAIGSVLIRTDLTVAEKIEAVESCLQCTSPDCAAFSKSDFEFVLAERTEKIPGRPAVPAVPGRVKLTVSESDYVALATLLRSSRVCAAAGIRIFHPAHTAFTSLVRDRGSALSRACDERWREVFSVVRDAVDAARAERPFSTMS